MAESPRRRILAHVRLADICCVIGLALNFMWCSLEGHALRFAETAAQFQFPLNPRGFWLMGFCLLALLYLAVPHWLKRWENTLKGIVPLCGAAGTLAFATAPLQSAVPPLALGLAVSRTRLLLVRLALLHPHGPCSLDHGHCLGHRRRRAFEDLPFARCNRSAGFRGPGSLRLRHSHLELVASLDRPAFPWRHRSIQSRTPHARGKDLPSGPARLHTAAHSQRLPSCHRASTQLLGNMGRDLNVFHCALMGPSGAGHNGGMPRRFRVGCLCAHRFPFPWPSGSSPPSW